MRKFLLVICAAAGLGAGVFSPIFARENPFAPVVKIERPSELNKEVEFSKLAFSFPKDARKLTRMKLEYLAMDGSIKVHVIDAQQPIDWHKNYLLISEDQYVIDLNSKAKNFAQNGAKISAQNGGKFTALSPQAAGAKAGASGEAAAGASGGAVNSTASANSADFATTGAAGNSAVGAATASAESSAKMRAPVPNAAPAVPEIRRSSFSLSEQRDQVAIEEGPDAERIKINQNVEIIIRAQSVKINTPGKLVRQFALNQPDRIVLDFSPISVRSSHTFPLLNSSFDSMLIGIHKDFFRVVLHTDSKYDYELTYDAKGCMVKLK